jgi:hypothetical protein
MEECVSWVRERFNDLFVIIPLGKNMRKEKLCTSKEKIYERSCEIYNELFVKTINDVLKRFPKGFKKFGVEFWEGKKFPHVIERDENDP